MPRYSRQAKNTAPRLISLVLLITLAGIQYPLWYGKGSERNLAELKVQVAEQKATNEALRAELDRLQLEAESLRDGKEALESRARERLNMIRDNEVLFRLSDPDGAKN